LGGGGGSEGQRGEVAQTMYTHMNKCKSNENRAFVFSVPFTWNIIPKELSKISSFSFSSLLKVHFLRVKDQ
jgi:hypothetical protein